MYQVKYQGLYQKKVRRLILPFTQNIADAGIIQMFFETISQKQIRFLGGRYEYFTIAPSFESR